jgi:hypothetical protein
MRHACHIWLLRDAVVALPGGVLRRLDLLAALAAEDADEAAHRVRLPAGGFYDLGQGDAPGALYHGDYFRFLIAAGFIGTLLRPGATRTLAGDFLALPLAGATSVVGCAPSGDSRATACQIRVTAAFRLVNFFTGFRSSNGATPAKLF